jgi:hypothetical protein
MEFKLINSKFALLPIVLLLAACGGGGGSSSNVTNADPQGYWIGPASTGYTVNAVVLDTGETWGVYSSGSLIYGALYGHTSVSGSNVTITGTDFNFLSNTSAPGTLVGTVTPRSSMSLSGTGITLPLTYQTTYDTAASSTTATGTWSFTGRSGLYFLTPGTFTVDNTGHFTLNQTNCITTGSIIPRTGGKNVYNVSLASSGVGCAVGYNNLNGVAYIDTTVTPNKFISLALTTSQNDGLIVLGTKQ